MRTVVSLVVLLSVCEQTTSGKLLAILLDGFRWDYLERGLSLPAFDKIFEEGTRVKRLVPSFPSASYPNYYSLFTGLYAESHGFVGNRFYDPTTNRIYTPSDTGLTLQDRSFMYDEAEPLWITAVKQDMKAYMFHWVDCDVLIRGRLPTYCRKYSSSPTSQEFRQALDESLELFKNSTADLSDTRARFSMHLPTVVYFENVDVTGHRYGPNSSNVNTASEEVDAELNRLLTKISENGLDKEVDVMIFSDHGMSPVSPLRVVNITDVIPTSSVDVMIGYDAFVFIWPKDGRLEEIYSALTSYSPHLTVYRRDDVPDKWHFQHHRRIPPILAVLDIPWYMVTSNFDYYYYSGTGAQLGSHGYDPQQSDMGAFFSGVGPSFVPGTSAETLDNVNVYQIMCHSLGIKPRFHNGTWSRVSHMISSVSPSACLEVSASLLFTCLLLLANVLSKCLWSL